MRLKHSVSGTDQKPQYARAKAACSHFQIARSTLWQWTKTRHGFRVRAVDQRKKQEIAAREQELVAGYGDLAYSGFVHITAGDLDTLDDGSADIEQTAAHAGVLLRPLDGRHGAGWVAGLPLGRTLTTR